ncbi:Hpt domain-containing protein [Enterovibrio norvegicus]|uniref:Hpt domain-containing protein n=1 Tax=Enterovibrio norvegicus TaxID=188144 RepID=UPI00389A8E4B
MISKLSMFALNSRKKTRNSQRLQLSRLSMLVWVLFFISFFYAVATYKEMYHVKEHATHVVKLNNVAQQLRQAVSASMLNQQIELSNIEKEIQHFRYLLLQTKSHTIDDQWSDIQSTLLDADAFAEDVDNLLASIYSVANVTKKLKQLSESEISIDQQLFYQSISSYLLYELHGLNDSGTTRRADRFNEYIATLEAMLAERSSKPASVEVYALYTGLERLNQQLENVDSIMNHRFVRAMTQQQTYWTTQVIALLDRTLLLFGIAFLFLAAQVLVRYKLERLSTNFSRKMPPISSEDIGFIQNDAVQYDQSVFEIENLMEQLEGDTDAIDAVLGMFVEEHKTDGEKLQTFAKNDDVEGTRGLIHSMKGVSGNIGAYAMQHFCIQLEKTLSAGESPDKRAVEQFDQLLALTIKDVLSEMENLNKMTTS